jgi:hypothetical protein
MSLCILLIPVADRIGDLKRPGVVELGLFNFLDIELEAAVLKWEECAWVMEKPEGKRG